MDAIHECKEKVKEHILKGFYRLSFGSLVIMETVQKKQQNSKKNY